PFGAPVRRLWTKPAECLGCYELTSEGLDAEQVNSRGVVTAIPDGEVATNRKDEVIPARREDGAGIADDVGAMNARNHVAEVARGRVSALALGALEERVVPRRRQDALVGAADAVRIEPLHGVQDLGDCLTRLRPVLRGQRGRLIGDAEG